MAVLRRAICRDTVGHLDDNVRQGGKVCTELNLLGELSSEES